MNYSKFSSWISKQIKVSKRLKPTSFFEQTTFWNSISDDLITGVEEFTVITQYDEI